MMNLHEISYAWCSTTLQIFLKQLCANTCNVTAIKTNFHFSSISTVLIEAHAMNISTKFQLKFQFILHIASEELTFDFFPQKFSLFFAMTTSQVKKFGQKYRFGRGPFKKYFRKPLSKYVQ